MLFVAGEDDRDVQVAQRARGLERLEGVQNHDVPALHVGATDGARGRILAHEVGAAGIDDRVEVADEEKPHCPGLAAVLSDEMPRATDRVGHGGPARREAKGVERGAEHRADLPHALEIQRAAGDVDDTLQVRDLLFARRGDGRAHALLLAVQGLGGNPRPEQRKNWEDDGETNHYGVALTVSCARRRSSASRSACLRSRSSRT